MWVPYINNQDIKEYVPIVWFIKPLACGQLNYDESNKNSVVLIPNAILKG